MKKCIFPKFHYNPFPLKIVFICCILLVTCKLKSVEKDNKECSFTFFGTKCSHDYSHLNCFKIIFMSMLINLNTKKNLKFISFNQEKWQSDAIILQFSIFCVYRERERERERSYAVCCHHCDEEEKCLTTEDQPEVGPDHVLSFLFMSRINCVLIIIRLHRM